MLGWLIFLIGVGVSIGLHEVGHLLPAKAFGVKVTQYMVGFGPTAWAKRRGETEYGVKWIPLGGYIRMIGMYPPEKGADPTMLRASSTGRWSTLINDARQASLEEVKPEDADRVFYKLPVRKRTATGASTDASVLQELAEAGHVLPELLLEYRELFKLEGTYLDTLPTLVHA